MLALYRSGRQADALETFQEARQVLSDELGLEPGPELRRLQDAILGHDPAIAAVPAGRRRRGNLPATSTSFVGREEEEREVRELLHEHRLVTVTGAPGVGKSRLAVESARSLEDVFPDGIWLVDFARAGDAGDALRLLANAVDVRGSNALSRVCLRLQGDTALVVLDACEHVLEEAALIASTLLAECPGVRVLATSREALHVPGEARLPLAPLGSAAVDLFLERARAARPGFEPDAADAELAAEIAERLDGLPLALELAAARVNVLGFGELVSILDRRAALLRDSPESDPARSALQGLVEWSYDLLHGDEKTLLHKLAVHRGGASLASLVAIAGTAGLNEATVTYLVGALVDKSIVSVSFPDGVARYDLLDSVREYVLGELERSGRLETVRGAHAEHFAALAADAAVELRGPEWRPWETRLESENDNLWAALAYARDGSDSSVAARLGMLGWYFALAERISEGRSFLDLAVSLTGEDAPAELRIEQLSVLGYLAIEERDLEGALLIGERALALATSAGPRELGLAQLTYALALAETGQEEQADRLSRDAIAKLEAAGDHWGAAAAAISRATTAAAAGDVDTVDAMTDTIRRHADAIDYDAFREPGLLLEAWVAERRGHQEAAVEGYRRALELGRRIGFRDHEAFALCGLGSNAFGRGDLCEASGRLHEALALAQAADAAWVVAHARAELARVAAASGHADEAADLYRDVLAWARAQRPHQARENLARALAGDPAAAAELGLAELGETALT
jgi:predicted ATPase